MDMGPRFIGNVSFSKDMRAFSLKILLSQIHIVDHTSSSLAVMRYLSQSIIVTVLALPFVYDLDVKHGWLYIYSWR
jgi:hypothetical protein